MDTKNILKKIKSQKVRKFDESVEVILSVVQPKSGDAAIRMDINIPNSFGKQKSVLVLCDKSEADGAKGADFIGLEDFVEKIKNGWREFDVVIATPTVMPKIAILGKYLGSSGLMPNPKNGTVTKDVAKAIGEFKSGKINIKSNKSGQIQLAVGKKSMDDEKLSENIEYTVKTLSEGIEKNFNTKVKSIFVKTSMGVPYRLI
ncbi:MAG: 50S ribosomal protein L1 [bacterium]